MDLLYRFGVVYERMHTHHCQLMNILLLYETFMNGTNYAVDSLANIQVMDITGRLQLPRLDQFLQARHRPLAAGDGRPNARTPDVDVSILRGMDRV